MIEPAIRKRAIAIAIADIEYHLAKAKVIASRDEIYVTALKLILAERWYMKKAKIMVAGENHG